MNLFLDTNIIIEYLFDRKQSAIILQILDKLYAGEVECYVSSGSFYTLTYLIGSNFKDQKITNPRRLKKLREVLHQLLSLFHIQSIEQADFVNAVNDLAFKDLEDSYQYQTAILAQCVVLLTINKKDFVNSNQESIEVLTPQEYAEKYM